MFDSSKVARRSYQAFPEAEYNLELDKAQAREAATGTWQVLITFRIRGERYNNLTVFEQLSFTENSFEVSINKLLDMGVQIPAIKTASAKSAAETIAKALKPGHMTRGRVYEQARDNGGYTRQVRGYVPVK